jgi:hypothetical protein
MQHYEFQSIQQHVMMGPNGHLKRVTEGVALQNGEGIKAVEIQSNDDVKRAVRPLSTPEVANIQGRKFMPNLFQECHGDCHAQATKKRKVRKAAKKAKTKKQQKRGK